MSSLPQFGSSQVLNRLTSKPRGTAGGPLAALEGDPFTSDCYIYPLDLENLAHGMVFNINVQDVQENESIVSSPNMSASRADSLANPEKFAPGSPLSSSNPISTARTFRKTRRIATSIGLYVPETLVFQNDQEYSDPSLLGMGITGISQLQKVLKNVGSGDYGSAIGNGVGAIAALAALQYLPEIKAISAIGLGYAINPILEVIYAQPRLREFEFNFVFAPRNQYEADQVFQIIQIFRQYSAPTLSSSLTPSKLANRLSPAFGETISKIITSAADAVGGSIGLDGAFFVPPSTWDITLMRMDGNLGYFTENSNIPGISTCVLTNVLSDYSPENQFVTFHDGMPVEIKLLLRFKEIDIITSDRIRAGL